MARSKLSASFAALALVGVSVFAGGMLSANAVAAPPVIDSPVTGTTSIDLYPTISGTIAPSGSEERTVTVSVTNLAGTGVYCTAVVPYFDTAWSCGYSTDDFNLQYSDNTFTATAVDETDPGTPSAVSNTVVVTIGGDQDVSMLTPSDGDIVHDSTPYFEGFGPTLGQAHVYIGGEGELCSADIDISGYWLCESTVELPEGGPYDIAATSTLITGATSPAFVGPIYISYVAPPAAPVITSPTTGLTTYNQTATFAGTVPNPTDEHLTVIVYAPGDGDTEMCSTEVFSGQTWSCDALLYSSNQEYFARAYFNPEGTDFGNPSLASNSVYAQYLGPVPLPTMNYALGAASIGISGNGVTGSELESGFYSAIANGEGYNFDLIANCPAGGGGSDFAAAPAKVEFASLGPTPIACTFANLSPGVYNAYTYQTIDGVDSEYTDDYIMIPTTPTFGAGLASDGSVVFSGSGTPGYLVIVQTSGGTGVCSATVSAGETWQCSATQSVGPHQYRAVQQSQGWDAQTVEWPYGSFQGYSAYTAIASVTVPAPPVPPTPGPTASPTPTPTPTTPPVALVWNFSAGGGEFEPGDQTDISGNGLPAGATIDAEFHSTPVALGSTVVKPDGSFSMHVTIPEDATAGLHHFVVTITLPDGQSSTQEQPVTIKMPTKATSSPTKEEVAASLALTGDDATGSDGGGGDRSDPATPSSLTKSIPTFPTILANPAVIGAAAVAGLVLLLLVALPAELLNSTFSEQYPRFAKRLPRMTWAQRFSAWFTRVPVAGGLGLTLLAALIFGFTDPNFGFDVVSLRVVMACALALFVVGFLASTISGRIIRRRWDLATAMELKPLGIALALVGVLISRLIDFSPGFMLGLILGITLVGRTTVAQRAKATLVQAGVVFVLAVLGWVAYSILSATTEPDSFFTALMFDTSVAITAEGLTALFVGMLPFRFLDGEAVFQYNKVLWAASYVVAALAFVAIVVPNSFGELDTPAGTFGLVVGIFAVLALGIWAYFRFVAKPFEEEDEDEPAKEQVDA